MRTFLRFLKPYRGLCLLTLLVMALDVAGALYLPTIVADMINIGVAGGDLDFILRKGGLMLGVALVSGGGTLMGCFLCARLSHTEQADPRPLKLCLCLQEIPSVSPQPRIILCNHCRTGRSGKTGNKGSCPEMLTDILRLMAVCGRHHIHCHAGCFHFLS